MMLLLLLFSAFVAHKSAHSRLYDEVLEYTNEYQINKNAFIELVYPKASYDDWEIVDADHGVRSMLDSEVAKQIEADIMEIDELLANAKAIENNIRSMDTLEYLEQRKNELSVNNEKEIKKFVGLRVMTEMQRIMDCQKELDRLQQRITSLKNLNQELLHIYKKIRNLQPDIVAKINAFITNNK